jgi:HlyD family secretion protein
MKRFVKKFIVVTVLLAALVLVWSSFDGSADAPQYRTAKITRGDIAEVVTANGTLNPMELVTIGTQVSGQISKIYVNVNDEVKKGQLLAEIDPSLVEAELKQTKTGMETARLSYEQAGRDLERTRVLVQKDFLPKIDLERAQQSYFSARNSYESAQTTVERAEVNLSYTKIYSPIDGVVISQEVTMGQTVAASYQTPNLFKIAGDLKKMKIEVNYPESDISKVKKGQTVKFTVDAYPDRVFEGIVDFVNLNPKTDQGVVTYSVTVVVNNEEKKLYPGMTAYVNVTLSEVKDVLRVPPAALRFVPPQDQSGGLKSLFQPTMRGYRFPQQRPNVEGKGTVYLLNKGRPKEVEVTLGKTDESFIAVSSADIKEGDEVILGIMPTLKR